MNQLDSNHINTLIIDKNKGWKQDIKLGTENNQKNHIYTIQSIHSNILRKKSVMLFITNR